VQNCVEAVEGVQSAKVREDPTKDTNEQEKCPVHPGEYSPPGGAAPSEPDNYKSEDHMKDFMKRLWTEAETRDVPEKGQGD